MPSRLLQYVPSRHIHTTLPRTPFLGSLIVLIFDSDYAYALPILPLTHLFPLSNEISLYNRPYFVLTVQIQQNHDAQDG